MSWFARIFNRSRPVSPESSPQTVPQERRRSASSSGAINPAHGRRKSDRAIRRELLSSLVREAMVGLGVLSSHFKFKVLSVDQKGTQFLVMVDLSEDINLPASSLANMESTIAQRAYSQRKLRVNAVYWRYDKAEAVLPGGRSGPRPLDPEGSPTGAASPSGFPVTETTADVPIDQELGATQYGEMR